MHARRKDTVLVIFDTHFYWTHRLCHASRWLYRRFHAVHHAVRFPDAWSLEYQHPIDYLLTTVAPMAWVALLPLHLGVASYITALVMANFLNIAGHAGHEVSASVVGAATFNGWAALVDPARRGVARWFNNVLHHDLHHQSFRLNYSLYFTVWDRLCGTLHPDTDRVESYLAAAKSRT